jgi:hypothetical protein
MPPPDGTRLEVNKLGHDQAPRPPRHAVEALVSSDRGTYSEPSK